MMPVFKANDFTKVPCFVCGNNLHRALKAEEMQPLEGVVCETSGNYGSMVLDGETLMFLICDRCLKDRSARVKKVKRRKVEYTSYVNWPELPSIDSTPRRQDG